MLFYWKDCYTIVTWCNRLQGEWMSVVLSTLRYLQLFYKIVVCRFPFRAGVISAFYIRNRDFTGDTSKGNSGELFRAEELDIMEMQKSVYLKADFYLTSSRNDSSIQHEFFMAVISKFFQSCFFFFFPVGTQDKL